MMEFFTTYQIPLIFGGLLIIMGLIGYEADQREKMKNGDKESKKKKKNKKNASANVEALVEEENKIENEIQVAPENTVSVAEVEVVDDNAAYQYEEESVNVEYNNANVVEQSSEQLVSYDSQTTVSQPEVNKAQSVENSESLQAFAESTASVQGTDTFGVNDMSSFQVQQGANNDATSGNIDAWKL